MSATDKRSFTLVPFHIAEALTLKEAAHLAGKCERTVRNWCELYGIGRRVGAGIRTVGRVDGTARRAGGGTWSVSRVALKMFLDGDMEALISYRDHGVRASYEPVRRYYEQVDLGDLLSLREFAI